ncbi:unnamed protein product [Tetraodon nigroviridis]|uniref:(spotted green pufferfish) hypothetical protein n=1 Tax=Tetraodon nigroviridis TaxID=99883 RepID=Q4RPW7_TETNG|nr:unnamed protein product [Tetraodon nigroviridis]
MGWMTNEMEETGDEGIKERTDETLLTLHPSLNSKCINISNESALNHFKNIPQLFPGFGALEYLQLCPQSAGALKACLSGSSLMLPRPLMDAPTKSELTTEAVEQLEGGLLLLADVAGP